MKHCSQVNGVVFGVGVVVVNGVDYGTLLLWSLNPAASLSLPTICWPSLACWQSSLL